MNSALVGQFLGDIVESISFHCVVMRQQLVASLVLVSAMVNTSAAAIQSVLFVGCRQCEISVLCYSCLSHFQLCVCVS